MADRYPSRADEPAYKRWYKTAKWQRLRAKQLAEHPLCAMHEARKEIVVATVCDHVERHKGDEVKFWAGPFQSLCKACHDSDKQRVEKGGRAIAAIDDDGWPRG